MENNHERGSVLDEALAMAESGTPVFPCTRGKAPLTKHGFYDATTDAEQIRKWWSEHPHALVGIPTGKASGVDVIDLDRNEDVDGVEALKALEAQHTKLDATMVCRTQSNGFHLYFKHVDGVGNSQSQIGPGIDVRGEGGYVISPPSPGYRWEKCAAPGDAPEWLVELAKPPKREPPKSKPFEPASPDDVREALSFISPDMPYSEWVRVGMALHAEGIGFELFHSWSAAGSKYRGEIDCRKHWRSFNGEGVGIGTVFHLAKESGWRRKGAEARSTPNEKEEPRWPPKREALMPTGDEVKNAELAPRCIVTNYLYCDVGQIVSPGGTGKTTMLLHEAVCIALKRPVWGMETLTDGWTLFVTKEDQRERLLARLREIMTAMDLTDAEREKVLRRVIILDVTGADNKKLLFVEDGNIRRTNVARMIVDAYRDDRPLQIIFDPTVSFGASEGLVNDNEQGLIEVGRYIVNELGCSFRYVHHTGKANARAKESDQYSGRGGSALADGSRMTVVLEAWDRKETPPMGCAIGRFVSAFKLKRHKVSYAPPNQPVIWIRRDGFAFDAFTEAQQTPDEQREARIDQVERFLTSRLKDGEHHTQNTLIAQKSVMGGIPRDDLREAISTLLARGRVIEKELPKELRHGGRKFYLCPSNCAEVSG